MRYIRNLSSVEYRLLNEFRSLFEGKKYKHRNPTLGDFVALHLYEDLASVKKSSKYLLAVKQVTRVLNVDNKPRGFVARRGDGTFGELIVGEEPAIEPGYKVARGPVATVEIGIEVKILSKAMGKQMDRVKGDLIRQAQNFRYRCGSSQPICIAIVGVNHAAVTTSYDGERAYKTDGKGEKHPIQEAAKAVASLAEIGDHFDEFLILPYKAENEAPYTFEWVSEARTRQEYGAALIRVSNEYQRRF